MTFGEEVKRLRTLKGLTQVQLAELLGVHQVTVAYMETGKQLCPLKYYHLLCDALGVKCDHFRPFLGGETPVDAVKSKRK